MISLTKLFQDEIDFAFQSPMDVLDLEFKSHLVFVFNQTVQVLRKTGWTRETLVTVGDLLQRLFAVYGAYRSKKKRYTLAEWIGRLSSIGGQLESLAANLP